MTSHASPFDTSLDLLKTLANRWPQLTLDQAEAAAPQARALAAQCQCWHAEYAGGPAPQELRDLGPATALNQLTVCLNELVDSLRDPKIGTDQHLLIANQLAQQLRDLVDALYNHGHSLAAPHTHGL